MKTMRWFSALLVSLLAISLYADESRVAPGGSQDKPLTSLSQPNPMNLAADLSQWIVNIDQGGTKISLAGDDNGMVMDVTADGGQEDYPKAHRAFAQPQDWRDYTRLNLRLRVVCDDPAVRHKMIAPVFYDEHTRWEDREGRPMKQQVVSRVLPVNQWIDWSIWLGEIQCSAIRQFVLYLYELPPAQVHHYRWEIARLELEKIDGALDTIAFPRVLREGAAGQPVGSVSTGDGLQLEIDSAGELARVAVDGKTIGAAGDTCLSGLLVRDATTNDPPRMIGGRLEQAGGEIRQAAEVGELGLTINASYRAQAGYIEIAGTVADRQNRDRAITIYFAVPAAEGPWKWWDSAAAARSGHGELVELSCLETGMDYGLNGCHSRYPLGAITLPGSAGLTLAIRMDEPVVHRIAYNPRLHLFYLAIDFGLVPERRVDGRPLSEAPFRILLYRHDPAWGFRSALQRYYEYFPGFFTKRAAKEGGWYVWGDMSQTEGALEAGLGFHWGPAGAEAVQWDNTHGPLALFYIEPQTYQQTMEDFDRQPDVDEVLERLRKLEQGDPEELARVASQPYRVYPVSTTGGSLEKNIQATAQIVMDSLNHDLAGRPYCIIGQFEWMQKSKWGAILSCNLAPGIPNGKGQMNLQQIIGPALRDIETAGARYDGIGLDSLGGYGTHSMVNYRRAHFPYSKFPLSFSAIDYTPVQVAAFTTVEWLGTLAESVHAEGKILMANCSWYMTPGWLTFAAPYLDVFGAEAVEFADPDFIRALAYRKPCTDLPYTPRPAWEVARHWLHAIHPGHGNDLKMMQGCAGLLRDLIAAGWEPITGAGVSPETVCVERYGGGRRIYLVLHNPADQPAAAQVRLDREILGEGDYDAVVLPGDQLITIKNSGAEVSLAPKETLVLALTRR